MPAKIARLATRPPFWIPEVSVAVRSSRPSCSNAETPEYSWQIGSHPGNPGQYECGQAQYLGYRAYKGNLRSDSAFQARSRLE